MVSPVIKKSFKKVKRISKVAPKHKKSVRNWAKLFSYGSSPGTVQGYILQLENEKTGLQEIVNTLSTKDGYSKLVVCERKGCAGIVFAERSNNSPNRRRILAYKRRIHEINFRLKVLYDVRKEEFYYEKESYADPERPL